MDLAGKAVAADPAGTAVHILTPTLSTIRGTLETVPAVAGVAAFAVEPDGSLSCEHSGETDIFWDGMATEVREHPDTGRPGAIFLDHSGNEFHEDDLLRCLPEARVTGCPSCADAAQPEAAA